MDPVMDPITGDTVLFYLLGVSFDEGKNDFIIYFDLFYLNSRL